MSTMKTTEARRAIKHEYQKITGKEFFVPLKYTSLVHAVKTGTMSAKEAAKAILHEQDISSTDPVLTTPPAPPGFDFSQYRSAF